MNKFKQSTIVIIAVCIGINLGWFAKAVIAKKPNEFPTFGETGLPKNCKAIIAQNINMYETFKIQHRNDVIDLQDYLTEVDGVMWSINRNCGLFGMSWEYD